MWLLLFVILARLLGPKAYGVFAIAMVFVGFFEIAVVGAAVEALVTVPDLDANHLRTVNLCSIVMAIFAGAIIFSSADLWAQWFDSTDLKPVFRMLAPLPVISARNPQRPRQYCPGNRNSVRLPCVQLLVSQSGVLSASDLLSAGLVSDLWRHKFWLSG